MKKTSALAIVLALLASATSRSEPIQFYYPARPPYNFTLNGKPTGFLVELTQAILHDAEVEAVFVELPSPRIFSELQREDSQCCLFGALKVPEREAYGSFTLPIMEDSPLVALILAKNAALFFGKTSFRELAADKKLTLGLIRSWSYGDYVDGVIKKEHAKVIGIPEKENQARMLASERFLYTLARETEIDDLIRLSGKSRADFVSIPLSDTSERKKRYILCGKGVPGEVIERINASIVKHCDVRE
ncbi:MAG: transporter substrate-binding domain-containing protein [Desulfovibrio sp.]|nr:transporter substrate-binding domain-containing protein [Desulfovibrio sp.]MBI4960454.1 transporter substrate-binding domain-containing protein [Desulfovibrio sp.]